MSFLESSSSKSIPQPLPSLPPSPTEEDLGGASLWKEEHETPKRQRMSNGSVKGKERAREISLDEDEDEVVEEDGELTPTVVDSGYPPSKDEEEESRRVEQNLKRLEAEERQRRKAARESAAAAAPSSVISDVSRRASLLFTSSRRSGSTGSRPSLHHVHSQLGQSSEDALPLGDLHANSKSLLSPAGSKSPSPAPRNRRKLPISTISENPFEPPDSATPLRSFQQQQDDLQDTEGEELTASAVMRPSSPPPSSPLSEQPAKGSPFNDNDREGLAAPAVDRPPLLQASSSFSRPHPAPPPLPLDLPPPKTPPPRTHTPGGTPIISSPPKRVSPPSTRGGTGTNGDSANRDRSDEEERRWWTDWLCGCREDKDRDNAGRTNPFE